MERQEQILENSSETPALGHKTGRSLFSDTGEDLEGGVQLSLNRPSKSLEGPPVQCPGWTNDHEEFDGTMLELGSRAKLDCLACSIIYDGLSTISRTCLSSKCGVSWKPQGKATLAVSVSHKCRPKLDLQTRRVVEFSHNLGPFDTIEILPSLRFGSTIPEKPEHNLTKMLEWIKNCETTHQHCRVSKNHQLPKRVIDVQGWKHHQLPVRLYESHGESARYVALSHRWGSNQLLKTTLKTLDSRKMAITWSDLSQTFQDAIVFTATLGVRYLWIDSLCIVQDCEADWQEESSKMAFIYENAFVTLAANNSKEEATGLFAPRKSKSAIIKFDVPGRPTVSVLVREALKHGQFYTLAAEKTRDSSYPLFERAWCFQERILATRIIHFTENEVVFECKAGCKCECTSIGLREEPFIKAHYQDLFAGKFYVNSWVGWRTVVMDYSKKRLTDSRDVLPALAGISSRLQCEELGEFLAGLWKKELIHGLFWYTKTSAPVPNPVYTAPSFSWASLIGRAKFEDLQWTNLYRGSSDIRQPNFKLLNVMCSVNGNNAYGEVSEGFVEIRATCHPVIVSHYPGSRRLEMTAIYQPREEEHQKATARTDRVFLDCGKMKVEKLFQQNLTCIVGFWVSSRGSSLIQRGVGLVLERVSKDSKDFVYQRVGYFEDLPYGPYPYVHDLYYGSERTIKIY